MTTTGFEHRLYGWKKEEEDSTDESIYLTTPARSLLDSTPEYAKNTGSTKVSPGALLSLLATPGPWSDLQPSYLVHYAKSWTPDWHKPLRETNYLPRAFYRYVPPLDEILQNGHRKRRDMGHKWTSVDHIMLSILEYIAGDPFLEDFLVTIGIARRKLIAQITADCVSKASGRVWGTRGIYKGLSEAFEDVARLAGRKKLDSPYGREGEEKMMLNLVLSGKPKIAILGPAGTEQTHFIDHIAVALARHRPRPNTAGIETHKIRLLTLNLNRLAVKESKKQGRAVEILNEARLEMERAIEEDEPGGQGIRYVIMIDGLYRALCQRSLAPALMLFIIDPKVHFIAVDTKEGWNAILASNAPLFETFDIITLNEPARPMAKIMAINIMKRILLQKPFEIDQPVVEEAINLILLLEPPRPFFSSFEAIMNNAVDLAVEAQNGEGLLEEMQLEASILAQEVEWMKLSAGGMAKAKALSLELNSKRSAIEQYSRNPKAGHVALIAIKSKFDAIVTVLRECYDIHDWVTLEASEQSNPKAYGLYPDLALWSNSIAMSEKTGYPAAHVTISDVQNAVKKLPRWSN